MTIRRLLMAAGGGSGFQPPSPPTSSFQVVAVPDAGGWTEPQFPNATYLDGQTYIAWVGGNSKVNDIQIISRHDGAGENTYDGPILLHDNLSDGSSTTPDSHNGPAIIPNEDGKIVAVYMGHQSSTVRSKVGNTAGDITAGFTTENNDTPISGTLTYAQLHLIESSGRIYRTFRRMSGGGAYLVRSHSDDGGLTWANGTPFYASGTGNLYSKAACWDDVMHFAVTDREPDNGNYGLWYFGMDPVTGDLLDADGNVIVDDADLPASPADLVEIVAQSGGDHYPYSITPTADGRPVIGWQTKDQDPVLFGEHRWDGSAFTDVQIGTSEPLAPAILSIGGGAHDWSDSLRFLHGRVISGDISVWLYTSDDDGATWDSGTMVATAECAPSPVTVHNAGPELSFLWFSEGFTGSDDFDPGLAGLA